MRKERHRKISCFLRQMRPQREKSRKIECLSDFLFTFAVCWTRWFYHTATCFGTRRVMSVWCSFMPCFPPVLKVCQF